MADLEIKGIRRHFKGKQVLNNITFSSNRGTMAGILGSNGSGKSTLLSILAGTQRAENGEFLWNGADLFKDKALRSQVVGYVPQGTPLMQELSARDNLRLWYDSEKLNRELEDGMLAMLGIPDFLTVPVGKMSGGMKKRLSIGCAIANDPMILLLDEPSAALDLVCRERILNYFRDFRSRGGVIIIATHDIQEVEMCDDLYLIKDGMLQPYVYDGNVHRLVGSL